MSETPFAVERLGGQSLDGFDCGVAALNTYLQTRAGQDTRRRVATCFVAVDRTDLSVVGYFTLSATHVDLSDLPNEMQRKLPRYRQVPAVRLGRLAVSLSHRRKNIGLGLLVVAVTRAMQSDIAAHLMVVDAKDEQSAAFYRNQCFQPDSANALVLYAPLTVLAKSMGLA